MLKSGLRRVWRGPDTLQLGLDVPLPVVLHPVDDALHGWLLQLDGRRRLPELLDAATGAGLDPQEAGRLLDRLLEAGLLADAGAPDPVLAGVPREVRDRIAPDLAAAALRDPRPDAAAHALRGRRGLTVTVVSDRLGAMLATLLEEAGVGVVGLAEDVPASRAVDGPHLLVVPAAVARARRRALAVAGRPHLVTEVGETVVRLGPLVEPGRTACFGCLELLRLDRDPGWAPVSAQLAGPAAGAGPTTLLRVAAGLAALHVLDRCSGGSPPEHDGVVEVALPLGRSTRLRCPPHPACGCTWPTGAPPVTMAR